MKELIYDLINHNDEKKVVLYTPEYEWIKTPQSNKREIILVYKNDAFYVEKIQDVLNFKNVVLTIICT